MHLVVLLWIAGGCYPTMLVGHSSCQQSQDFTDKNQGFFPSHSMRSSQPSQDIQSWTSKLPLPCSPWHLAFQKKRPTIFFSLGSSCFAPLLLWSWTWLPSACRIPPCIPSNGSCRNWWMPCRRPFNKPMMHRWGPFLQLAQLMDLSGVRPWKFVLTMCTQQQPYCVSIRGVISLFDRV